MLYTQYRGTLDSYHSFTYILDIAFCIWPLTFIIVTVDNSSTITSSECFAVFKQQVSKADVVVSDTVGQLNCSVAESAFIAYGLLKSKFFMQVLQQCKWKYNEWDLDLDNVWQFYMWVIILWVQWRI